jgi:hypothetical protein
MEEKQGKCVYISRVGGESGESLLIVVPSLIKDVLTSLKAARVSPGYPKLILRMMQNYSESTICEFPASEPFIFLLNFFSGLVFILPLPYAYFLSR